MEPIVLIHGYSSESKGSKSTDIAEIYGTLAKDLTKSPFNAPVVPVNVSRYVTLDDSISVDDITLAFDRVLKTQHPQLLDSGFNAIVHSTGALVIRNWVRRCSPKPSPVKRIIHLAGANFGSGWAHIGESLLVKWLRFIGQEGAERGLAVLDALELGSSWTIDLHRHFLQKGSAMLDDYEAMEFNIIGSQVPAQWFVVPFRYGKEDGSDGVVRVSASNLNFHYLAIGPTQRPLHVDWKEASDFAKKATKQSAQGKVSSEMDETGFGGGYYELKADYRPQTDESTGPLTTLRPVVPLAIPYQCAHSSADMGIVAGTQTRSEVLALIASALKTQKADYPSRVAEFEAVTDSTYERVKTEQHADGVRSLVRKVFFGSEAVNAPGQYDRHSQIVFRLRDQNGLPVKDYSIYFNSRGGEGRPQQIIDELFEDHHRNNATPHTIAFYLRTHAYDGTEWQARLEGVNGVDIEIDAVDAATNRILFVPMRLRLSSAQLQAWVQPHRTTIIDVEMLRLPSEDTFILF